ncbi:MAG: hypothetical protein WD005_05865 [Haliea sp.]
MFEWLESTPAAVWINFSLWGYPIMLALHVIGLSMAAGVFAIRDLRLLGFFDGIAWSSLDSLTRLGWSGFVINAASGSFLFIAQATTFIHNIPFLLKISIIFLAVICAAIIQNRLRKDAVDWDGRGSVAGEVRLVAAISLALWTGAIVAGRLVAYF